MKPSSTELWGWKVLVSLLLVIALSIVLAGCGGRKGKAPAEEQPSTEASSAQVEAVSEGEGVEGEALFREYCAKCHGLKGLGDGPSVGSLRTQGGMNLTILQDRTDEEIFTTIAGGKGTEMPPWALVLSDDEIWALVKYIRTLGSE